MDKKGGLYSPRSAWTCTARPGLSTGRQHISFFAELKRRNVFRVGIAYVIAAWLILQVADVLIDNIGAPDWVFPTLLMAWASVFCWR